MGWSGVLECVVWDMFCVAELSSMSTDCFFLVKRHSGNLKHDVELKHERTVNKHNQPSRGRLSALESLQQPLQQRRSHMWLNQSWSECIIFMNTLTIQWLMRTQRPSRCPVKLQNKNIVFFLTYTK